MKIEVTLVELGIFRAKDAWFQEFEHFPQFLRDKIQDKLEKELDDIAIMDYNVVGHTNESVFFEVDWAVEA